MEKEKARNSTRGQNVSTWDKATSSAMFYHTRPIVADEGTCLCHKHCQFCCVVPIVDIFPYNFISLRFVD